MDFFKKIKNSIDTSPFFDIDKEKIVGNAKRDWVIVLILFFLWAVLFSIVGIYLFFQINKGEIFIVVPDDTQLETTISRENLENVLKTYEDKETLLRNYRDNTPNIIDPSL